MMFAISYVHSDELHDEVLKKLSFQLDWRTWKQQLHYWNRTRGDVLGIVETRVGRM